MILVLICVSITYFKNDSKVVLATTKEFNIENLQDNEHMHVEVDSSGDKVPVPNGYVGSKATGENEIDTGYVIYEGTEEVNDSNVVEAQKTRNQYVWIPVPDASTMYGTDENGKKWGKLYTFTTDTGDGIDPVTGAKPLNWSEENGIIKILNKTNYREPDVITNDGNSDIDSKLKKLDLGIETSHDFLIQLEYEFNCMIKSIEKYKGFYIGRYETGNLNQDVPVIQKENSSIATQNWYSMYKKCKKLKNKNKNLETGMLWGNQWDRTLMWLIESGAKSKDEIIDSITWGNYQNTTFEYTTAEGGQATKKEGATTVIPTGSTEYTKANNIYDLAGNVSDWTNEAYSGYIRTCRGGFCATTNNNFYNSSFRDTGDKPTVSYVQLRLPCNVIY